MVMVAVRVQVIGVVEVKVMEELMEEGTVMEVVVEVMVMELVQVMEVM